MSSDRRPGTLQPRRQTGKLWACKHCGRNHWELLSDCVKCLNCGKVSKVAMSSEGAEK
jgi:hypothetical protein